MKRKIIKGETRYVSKQEDRWTHEPFYMASVEPNKVGRQYTLKGLMNCVHQEVFIPRFDCDNGQEARQDIDVALREKFGTSIEDYILKPEIHEVEVRTA